MENQLSHVIIGAAIEVHRTLGGAGLLESVYETCLCHELTLLDLSVQRQICIPIVYKGATVKEPLCLDILVERTVIVEVKATEKNQAVFEAQLLTYLRLTGKKLGLLINFGYPVVKDGVQRVVNGL